MVERPLSMREVPGSIPGFSKIARFLCILQLSFSFYLPHFSTGGLSFGFTDNVQICKIMKTRSKGYTESRSFFMFHLIAHSTR